ncbi:MAG: hypothetical protein PHD31_00190 [Candidatus Pacebacteria bacterium]|nr:hypothetical protein [Candidatus Paceibacterota bacterium]
MAKTAWVVSINMGYGHQRTAYPLRFFAEGKEIISANDYSGIPESDKKIWENSRGFYEFVSRFKKVPLLGEFAFYLFDLTQKINEFYPKRNLSSSNFTQQRTYPLFNKGWGKDLIERCSKKKIPFISTFYNTAFMAEHFNYPGDIFCIVCDTDMSRSWAPLNPKKSRIKYFAPTHRVANRLKLYGVKKENIIFSGYPLPIENIGGKHMETLKEDMGKRLLNLDPRKNYIEKYGALVREKIGKLPKESGRPLTIMFTVGGAGAQKEIGIEIIRRLKKSINEKRLKVILVAGIKNNIKEYFEKEINNGGLGDMLGNGIDIICENSFDKYYESFNLALRNTDILWTKPSELSFYAGLGLPIIIAPTIGSQEEFNRRWLLSSGYGIDQRDIEHIKDWLFDWLESGYFAEMAMEGFVEVEKMGTMKIKEEVQKCFG